MVYWIDDELDILEMVDMYFGSKIKIKTLPHCDLLPGLERGDIVIYDLVRVGDMPNKAEGVRYFSCSGSATTPCDFPKPLDLAQILLILRAHS